jgi:hypothetical protein
MSDPKDLDAIHDVALVSGLDVEPVVAREKVIALFIKWNYPPDGPSYEEVISAALAREGRSAAADPESARRAWARHLASRRVVPEVRALPEIESLHKGGHLLHMARGPSYGYVARSFAAIYVLVLVFDGPFDELRAKGAIAHALPTIERLVLALPPVDPEPPMAGAVAMRRRRPRRR